MKIFYLSFSRMNCFLTCGEQYWHRYLEKTKTPTNEFLIAGWCVHKGVEIDLKHKMKNGVVLDNDVYLSKVKEETSKEMEGKDIEYEKDNDHNSLQAKINRLAKLYHDEVAPNINPVAIEMPFRFEISPGIWYTGIIDLINNKNGWAEIQDTKTGKKRPNKGTASESFQLTGYAMALKYLHEVEKKDLGVNVADNIPVGLTTLADNKTPVVDYQYTIEDGSPITRGPKHFNQFMTIFETVTKGIQNEMFLPAKIEGFGSPCGYCNYKPHCKYQRR